MNLTKRQKEILDFIRSYRTDHGISPTQREIRERFELSSFGTVQKHLKRLEEKGALVARLEPEPRHLAPRGAAREPGDPAARPGRRRPADRAVPAGGVDRGPGHAARARAITSCCECAASRWSTTGSSTATTSSSRGGTAPRRDRPWSRSCAARRRSSGTTRRASRVRLQPANADDEAADSWTAAT